MRFNDLFIDNLSGGEFEKYLATLFVVLGYKVELTKNSGDYGADLILTKDNNITVVQAKRYDNTVGISAIQEVIGSKKYYKASKCMVITNNYFTSNAKELALYNNVELWDRDILIKAIVSSLNVNKKSESSINSKQDSKIDIKLNNEISKTIEEDELIDDVIKYIVDLQQISTSILQRAFRIGYNRAALIVDQLEDKGVISSRDDFGHRKVLVNKSNLKQCTKSGKVSSLNKFMSKFFKKYK